MCGKAHLNHIHVHIHIQTEKQTPIHVLRHSQRHTHSCYMWLHMRNVRGLVHTGPPEHTAVHTQASGGAYFLTPFSPPLIPSTFSFSFPSVNSGSCSLDSFLTRRVASILETGRKRRRGKQKSRDPKSHKHGGATWTMTADIQGWVSGEIDPTWKDEDSIVI